MTRLFAIPAPAAAGVRPPRPGGVAALIVVLVAGLCARPLVSETFLDGEPGFLSGIEEAAGGPRPSATVALDALLLSVAGVAFLVPLPRRGTRVIAIGIVGLILAIGVSCYAASDKSAALRAGGNLGTLAIVGVAVHRLAMSPWLARLALAALLATGGTQAMKCILQVSGELQDTREFWEKEWKPQLERDGADLTHPSIINYERRARSNEAMGFLSLSNLAASCLMMCLLPACGLLAGSFRRGAAPSTPETWSVRGVLIFIVLGTLAALWFTGSTGAFVATFAGLSAFAMLIAAAGPISRHPRAAAAVFAAAYLGVIAIVGTYGAARGTLPHPSLAFRWHYWSTTPAAVSDGWPMGLGRENFIAAYLRHKPAVSPEETRDPHNVWLTLLIELGPLGLAAGAVLLGGILVGGLRGLGPPTDPAAEKDAGGDDAAPPYAWAAIALAAVLLLIHGCLSGAFFGGMIHVQAWVLQVAAIWTLLFAVLVGLLRPATYGPLDSISLNAALAAALVAVLIHALVDFALMTPAGLAQFVLLAALALRKYEPRVPRSSSYPSQRAATAMPTGIMVLIGVMLGFVTIPTISAENVRDSLRARLMAAQSLADAEAALQRAGGLLTSDRLGDSVPRALAGTARQLSTATEMSPEKREHWLQQAREWTEEARRRNPQALAPRRELRATYVDLAEFFAMQDRETEEIDAYQHAANASDAAVEAYPTNPRLRIDAGESWYELWRLTRAAAHAARATEHLRRALAIDDLRPPEEVMRLREAERRKVDDLLRASEPGVQPTTTQSSEEN